MTLYIVSEHYTFLRAHWLAESTTFSLSKELNNEKDSLKISLIVACSSPSSGVTNVRAFLLVIFINSVTTINNMIEEIFKPYQSRGIKKRAVQEPKSF
jgi:hypothetical protein